MTDFTLITQASIDQPVEDTVEEIDPFKKQMLELEVMIQSLQGSVNTLLTQEVPLFLKTIEQNEEEEQLRFELFQTTIATLRETREETRQAWREVDEERKRIQLELDELAKQKSLLLETLEAQEKLDRILNLVVEATADTSIWESARPFQQEDILSQVEMFLAGKSGCMNFNDMGLGLTYESTAMDHILMKLFEQQHGRKPLTLWLTKLSLVKSSSMEIKRWNPDRTIIPIVENNKQQRGFLVTLAIANNALVITNYDALNTTPELLAAPWDIIFIDEVHKLKGGANPSGPTQLWEKTKQICKEATFLIFMSGSPIMNLPEDMWAYLHIFDPDLFPTLRDFTRRYTYGYGEEGVLIDFERLITAMSGQTIRRREDEVGIQLPDLEMIVHFTEHTPEQADIYQKIKNFALLELDDDTSYSITAIIAMLTRLRQVNIWPGSVQINNPLTGQVNLLECESSGKIDEAVELIEQLCGSEEQVVLFSAQFNDPMYEIQRRVGKEFKVVVLDSSIKDANKQCEVPFQQLEIDVLCINMMTGSEGLNLQRSPDKWPGGTHHGIFLDQWYNPETNRQAVKRYHRQGQTHGCFAHILYTENSVDDFIKDILELKEKMIEGIVEAKELRKGSDWKAYLEEKL